MHKNRGITALELLIVVSILVLLTAVVISPFLKFRQQSVLNTETQDMLSFVNKARLSAMSSKGDTQYGLHFQADRLVLFQGATYDPNATTNETHLFDSAITLGSITVNGGGADVLFERVTGATDQNATTTLRVIADTTASSTIIIRPSGVATLY